jgi:2,4-dienoyl-CoA reductase-like NADH-dependent reductase (Old Yellow Enzyme family)
MKHPLPYVNPCAGMTNMPQLFEKTFIKSLEIPNRTMRSATWTGLGDSDGFVTDMAPAFYSNLAYGGVGLIVTGYQYILNNGRQLPYMIGNCGEDRVDGLSKIAAAVHAHGGKVVPQIVHTGINAATKFFKEGDELWGPSATAGSASGTAPVEVDAPRIRLLVEAYASAADRAKRAGFDGVQLHGAHGYGINQFLSAAWNVRGDGYGGSVKNRYRFLAETLEAVRGAVGTDFPVMIKLNAHDFVEGGLVPEEAIQIARMLEADGIDLIEVSAGSAASPNNLGPVRKGVARKQDEAYMVDLAAAIKRSVRIPVATVGGIRSVERIQEILDQGQADYLAMSRPFIREPALVNRWKQGDTSRATCISCNGCFETGLAGIGISCKADREKAEKASAES